MRLLQVFEEREVKNLLKASENILSSLKLFLIFLGLEQNYL